MLAYVVDFSFYFIFFASLGLSPLLANAGSKIFAGVVAFTLHRKFTFRTHAGKGFFSESVGYIFALIANIPISSGILYLCFGFVGDPFGAKIMSDILVLGITYVFLSKLVFKMSNREQI